MSKSSAVADSLYEKERIKQIFEFSHEDDAIVGHANEQDNCEDPFQGGRQWEAWKR